MKDCKWMAMALELARRGMGLTRPNPPVGAVLVRNGRVVGSGFHRAAGHDHAEVIAIRNAGARAADSSLYVTLEPCSTHGRTPPCVNAIIAAGIKEVVVSVRDPNPVHAGRGLKRLAGNGIEVREGVMAREGALLIEPFAKWIVERKPFVTLKLAESLDGRIADRSGRSKWITGPAARKVVQDLRRSADAVCVGGNTVRVDNPSLLPRPAMARNPFRIVLSSSGNVPAGARVLTDAGRSRTVIAVTEAATDRTVQRIQGHGVDVWRLPSRKGGVSMKSLLTRMGREKILHALFEGGGRIAESLLEQGLVDELVLFIAPRLIGGCDSVPAFGKRHWGLTGGPEFRFEQVSMEGKDILLRGRPVRAP